MVNGWIRLVLVVLAVVTGVAREARAQAGPPSQTVPETISLSGPRVGVTFLSSGIRGKLQSDINAEVGSMISQFGWQKEKRFLSSDNGLTGVTEWVFLVGGMDQGVFLPSFSWLVGLRTIKGVEFAVGPNVTPAGIGLAGAAGVTFRAGNLNVPVNLAVVPTESGVRVSMLAGFNTRRR